MSGSADFVITWRFDHVTTTVELIHRKHHKSFHTWSNALLYGRDCTRHPPYISESIHVRIFDFKHSYPKHEIFYEVPKSTLTTETQDRRRGRISIRQALLWSAAATLRSCVTRQTRIVNQAIRCEISGDSGVMPFITDVRMAKSWLRIHFLHTVPRVLRKRGSRAPCLRVRSLHTILY